MGVRNVVEHTDRCRRYAITPVGRLPTGSGSRHVHANAVVAIGTITARLGVGSCSVEGQRPCIVELVGHVQADGEAVALGVVGVVGIEQVLATAALKCNRFDQLPRSGDDVV